MCNLFTIYFIKSYFIDKGKATCMIKAPTFKFMANQLILFQFDSKVQQVKCQNIRHKFCYHFDLSRPKKVNNSKKKLNKVRKSQEAILHLCLWSTFVPIFSSIRAKIENWNLGAFKGL